MVQKVGDKRLVRLPKNAKILSFFLVSKKIGEAIGCPIKSLIFP
jgi:hypothetical protein